MSVLSDSEIRKLCTGENRMITPFSEGVYRENTISYGLSSSGYDIRLGGKYKVFKNTCCVAVDPKEFKKDPHYASMIFDEFQVYPGDKITIPPHGYILGVSCETFDMPRNVLGECKGKSTYARCGILVNVTPIEPCMADDTEVLTDRGWEFLADVGIGDKVLTKGQPGEPDSYQKVEAKQAYEYDGQLLHFAGKSVDQLVTPDHMLFVHHRTQPNRKKWITVTGRVPAQEVFGRWNYSFDRQVVWTGENPETVDIAGRKWNAGDFLEFYGSWLGDGSAYLGSDGGYHVKLAVVTKDDKRKKFKEILDKLGFNYRLRDRGFEFFDKNLVLWLKQFGHAKRKYIHREFLNLSPTLLKRLYQGLMQSDGCALTDTYTTASYRLADDIQELIHKCGWAAIIRQEYKRFRNTGQGSLMFIVRKCDGQMTPKISPSRHRLVPYRGMVYDITVPNHVFMSRRNGKASWTGNCWKGQLVIEIGNMNPSPAVVYAHEGIAQIVFHLIHGEVEKGYADKYDGRQSKYQNQQGITLARV